MSEPRQESVAPAVAHRIEAIVSSAERAANEFRRQVEAASKEQADKVIEAAAAEARRIRHEAARSATEYLQDSRRIVDEFAAERIGRISALTDKLIEQTEQVQRRFAHAELVRRQIYDLIASLGQAAEEIAVEAQARDPTLPAAPEDPPGGSPSSTPTQPGGAASPAGREGTP